MKSIKTLALVTGLLAISGVSQAQFSSTWTAVSDYDFRGVSQSGKDPALQGSADYAFGDSGFSVGAWASNVDWAPAEDEIELDLYFNYTGKINDTFAWTAGATWYDYPDGDDLDGFWEAYVGFNAGAFSMKQWFADDYVAAGESAMYTEANYTEPMTDALSLALHVGYSWGDFWEDAETFDYAARPYADRVREARELYRAAGYSAARPLEVEIRYNSGEVHNRIAVAIASMWKEALGIETTLYAEEFRALLQTIQARKETQVFRSSWVGDYNDAYSFLQTQQSDFGINLTGYANPRYDELLDRAVHEADLGRRRAWLEQAERLMLADHPLLPIYFYVNKHMVKPRVQGWTDNVMNVQYSKALKLAGSS